MKDKINGIAINVVFVEHLINVNIDLTNMEEIKQGQLLIQSVWEVKMCFQYKRIVFIWLNMRDDINIIL